MAAQHYPGGAVQHGGGHAEPMEVDEEEGLPDTLAMRAPMGGGYDGKGEPSAAQDLPHSSDIPQHWVDMKPGTVSLPLPALHLHYIITI